MRPECIRLIPNRRIYNKIKIRLITFDYTSYQTYILKRAKRQGFCVKLNQLDFNGRSLTRLRERANASEEYPRKLITAK